MLRRSGNVLELRFTPSDGQSPYRSYFGWRTIGDRDQRAMAMTLVQQAAAWRKATMAAG